MNNVTYRFDIQHHSNGNITATCGKRSANDERKLARMIVEAGLPDGPLGVGRPGRTDYTVASLHAFAATTLTESDRGFSHGIYAPHPEHGEAMHPALKHAVAALRERRKTASGGGGATHVAGEGEKPLAALQNDMHGREERDERKAGGNRRRMG